MKQIFLDTETIDYVDDVKYDVLTQLAFIVLADSIEHHNQYCKPENLDKMTFNAMEATNITPEYLADKPLIQDTDAWKRLDELSKEPCYLFAHNVSFDLEVIRRTGIDVSNFILIDTMKLSRFINDKLALPWDSVRLSYLKYCLGLYNSREKLDRSLKIDTRELSSHNALSDVLDLILLWNYLKSNYKISLDRAVECTNTDLVLKYIPSGKDKGKEISELSYNSLVWYRDNFYDSDVKYTCAKLLEN